MVLADAYLLLSLDLMLPVLARERPPSRVDKEGEEAAAGGRGQRAAGEEQVGKRERRITPINGAFIY